MSKRLLPAALTLLLCACQQANQAAPIAQARTDAVAPGTPDRPIEVAPVALVPGAIPVYRAFKDYVVACDNTLHCTAVAARTDDQIGLYLVLQRDAGPTGAASLKLTHMGGEPLDASALTLDGTPSPLSKLPWKGAAEGTLELTDPASIKRFVDIAMNAGHIRLGPEDELSLSGLKAALLFIDEAQGRLDSVTALAKPGLLETNHVPAPPPALVLAKAYTPVPARLDEATASTLTKTVRQQAHDALKAADCEDGSSAVDIGNVDDAVALTSTDALVFVTCNSGAYQSESLLYRVAIDGRTPATRVVLPPTPFTVEDGRVVTFDTLVGADYDPATATLSEFSKGRGIADCGTSTTWRFDGRQFQLASFNSLDRCSGVGSEDWPMYWRTQG